MTNTLKIVGLMVCLTAGFCFVSNQKTDPSPLALENIEALASGEHLDIGFCYGEGSVECNGYWVEMKITGLSLE